MLESLVWRSVWHLLRQEPTDTLAADVDWLGRLVRLGESLSLVLSLDRPQELYYQHLNSVVFAQVQQIAEAGKGMTPEMHAQLRELLRLGEYLAVDVVAALEALERLR